MNPSSSDTPKPRPIQWPHAPVHYLCDHGTYFFTASTFNKFHYFNTRPRLDVLQRGLLSVTAEFRWRLEAWAIFSNHYHFIAHSPPDGAEQMPKLFQKLHAKTAIWLNKLDATPGRKVWHNYWEKKLTYHGSYLTRLNYVHQNAVKHGLVPVATHYPWCSAAWFEQHTDPAQVKVIYGMKTDTLNIYDDYVPVGLETIRDR